MDLSVNQRQNEPDSTAENPQNEDDKLDDVTQKLWQGRKNIKKIHYENIKNQVEFYFSPANLAKDRFMAKLIQEDQCKWYTKLIKWNKFYLNIFVDVPLAVFMKFNKVKNILNGSESEAIIKKALSRSTILELSEDETKVRRKENAPIKSQEEIDDCTLYIEQIPINSTHESISAVFSRFGKVNYVSLPRYKKSRQIKQFGFVEFDDKESIMKAINCFKKVDGVLQFASIKAENLLSITTHEKEEPEKPEENEAKSNENYADEPPAKKARIEVVEVAESEVDVPAAENKKDDDEVEKIEEATSSQENEDEPSKAAADSSINDEKVESTSDDAVKKKKNRHHKKKPGQKSFFDERTMAMKIMRKKDWKKMRNAYLNLERQKAKEIKKILRESYNKRNNNKIPEGQKFSPLTTASPRINFYGSPNDREDPADAACPPREASTASGLAFIPGVIVNIKFREPCLDFKEIKKEFKQYSYCNYVDILEGGAQCFIRVDAPNSAQELASQYSSCEYETEILKDGAEKEYWKKIFEKRDGKKGKEVPKKEQQVKRRRGREKLLDKISKAAQHIRFDDTEDVVE